MAHLKFYKDEKERWPQLVPGASYRSILDAAGRVVELRSRWQAHGRMDAPEAEMAVRRLARRFGLSLKPVDIEFTSGNRHSRAGAHRIVLNLDWTSYLTVAHELAHTYYWRKFKWETRAGHVGHGRRMAKVVDRFCSWIVGQGWHQGTLAHELAVAEAERAARHELREKEAATPPPLEARIARRREQVTRLERKVKGLTTRLTTARRSLAALERRLAVPPAPPKPPAPGVPRLSDKQRALARAKELGARIERPEAGLLEVFAPEGKTWSGLAKVEKMLAPNPSEPAPGTSPAPAQGAGGGGVEGGT